jgi:predicted house-cleaning noncanonical NTP pyrophosphatase (MazG superfamily)
MKIFKKLIRDNMPEIMAAKGTPITTRVLENDAEFIAALENKLLEEVQELRNKEQPPLVQIAYMHEILDELTRAYNLTPADITNERQQKKDERGGFKKRLLVEQ